MFIVLIVGVSSAQTPTKNSICLCCHVGYNSNAKYINVQRFSIKYCNIYMDPFKIQYRNLLMPKMLASEKVTEFKFSTTHPLAASN